MVKLPKGVIETIGLNSIDLISGFYLKYLRDCLRLEMEVWDCGSCCSISTLLLRRFKIERRKRVTERRKNERSKESKESVGNGGFFEEVEQNEDMKMKNNYQKKPPLIILSIPDFEEDISCKKICFLWRITVNRK